MNKDEYFKIGDNLNLPKRCPILDKCSRRAWSVYLLGYHDVNKSPFDNAFDFLIAEGELPKDFKENNIPLQGELPTTTIARDMFYFHDVCPEVNLFDKGAAAFFAREMACISGDWDKYNPEPKAKILECRHYSECPEFSKYQYDNAISTKLKTVNEIEDIKDLIIKDDLQSALQSAMAFAKRLNRLEKEQDCLILLNRQAELHRKAVGGTESPELLRVEKSKIVDSLLMVLNDLKSDK